MHAGPELCNPQEQQPLLLLKPTAGLMPPAAAAAKAAADADADAGHHHQTDQAIIRVITDPHTAAGEGGCGHSSSSRASSECGRGSVDTAGKPGLLVSPVAAGVSTGSFSGQAWLQLLLLVAGYAGETDATAAFCC